MTVCEVCGRTDWHVFADPRPDRSVTTAGTIVSTPLGKAQCRRCGLVQRIAGGYLSDTEFYAKEYGGYSARIGAATYDADRYATMAQWMDDAIGPHEPRTILDVGCGRGWAMQATGKVFPAATVWGIEPSESDSNLARGDGLHVVTGTLAEAAHRFTDVDLVYSNNVIQHTASPRGFLRDLLRLVGETGLVVVTCPDATDPSNEMMWADQNFSFAPRHLMGMAEEVGFAVKAWRRPPNAHFLRDKQLVVLARAAHDPVGAFDHAPPFDVATTLRPRDEYVKAWASLDAYLVDRIRNATRVFNFGASMWSHLLRGYCPDYWARVTACIVDNFEGTFMDRSVRPDARQLGENDVIVLGINPEHHPALEQRFRREGYETVRWDHLIQR
jgi:SAM-dependent methyltransferase